MPYARNSELPPGVKDALPDAAQSIYRNAYNSQAKRGLSEERCHSSAWGAVQNAGYHKGGDGKWVKKSQPGMNDVHVESPDDKKRRRKKPKKAPDDDHEEMHKADDGDPVTMVAKIVGTNEEQRIVYGWLSVVEKGGQPVIDLQGHVITQDEIEKALHNFMQYYRTVGEMHERFMDGDASVVAGFAVTDETAPMLEQAINEGIRGALIGVRVDPEAFEKVKSGELSAFSIGGRAVLEDMMEAS